MRTLPSQLARAFAAALALAASGAAAEPDAAPPSPAAPPAAGACDPAPEAWRDAARWARLRRGMSRFEVFCLLGEPGRASVYDGFERWEYPAALGSRVSFDERGRVVAWRRARD